MWWNIAKNVCLVHFSKIVWITGKVNCNLSIIFPVFSSTNKSLRTFYWKEPDRHLLIYHVYFSTFQKFSILGHGIKIPLQTIFMAFVKHWSKKKNFNFQSNYARYEKKIGNIIISSKMIQGCDFFWKPGEPGNVRDYVYILEKHKVSNIILTTSFTVQKCHLKMHKIFKMFHKK